MSRVIPAVMRKWQVARIMSDFRGACELVSVPVPQPGPKQVLVKNRYVGVNASDVNMAAGRYDPRMKPPFDIGFESVGEVVRTGSEVSSLKEGQVVAHMTGGAYAEYQVLDEPMAFPLLTARPEFIPLLVSGLSASIALDKVGEVKAGETVLVTAAAGGAGQIAVQCAKLAGCHVIGTCSTQEKADMLKGLGCDRVINYKTEDLSKTLRKEYPRGVNVIFENVGGDILNAGINNIAKRGRIILFGAISSYKDSDAATPINLISIIAKSAQLRGFFVFDFAEFMPEYSQRLAALLVSGKLKTVVDLGQGAAGGSFAGIEDVPRAVEYMYSGANVGKVVVDLEGKPSSAL